MNTLNFKKWLEDAVADLAKQQSDPAVKNVGQAGVNAALMAQKKGKSPLDAAQKAVLQQAANGSLPLNKLGNVIPKDPTQGVEV